MKNLRNYTTVNVISASKDKERIIYCYTDNYEGYIHKNLLGLYDIWVWQDSDDFADLGTDLWCGSHANMRDAVTDLCHLLRLKEWNRRGKPRRWGH